MAPIGTQTPAWKTFVQEQKGGSSNFISDGWFELYYNGRVLKYMVDVFGTQPPAGFPLYIGLHGGGEAKLTENDDSWKDFFTNWYRDSISDPSQSNASGAVYVTPRGISSLRNDDPSQPFDEYNIHWRPESYLLIQRMIANLLLPDPKEIETIKGKDPSKIKLNSEAQQFVDSDRVYLLGHSAGGDGVYQLAAKLSERFAAAVVGAGHPNGANFTNMANMPICLQCGERDVVWGGGHSDSRARVTIDAAASIVLPENIEIPRYWRTNSTWACPPSWYFCECHIIKDGDHSAWAISEQRKRPQKVLTNLAVWYDQKQADKPLKDMSKGTRDMVLKNINAVAWASQFTRESCPTKVIWDLSCRPPRYDKLDPAPPEHLRPERFFHWLYIRDPTAGDYKENDVVLADYGWNWIRVSKPKEYLGLLLNESMIGFDRSISVLIAVDNDNEWQTVASFGANELKPSEAIMVDTLRAKGDPKLMFSAMLVFKPDSAAAGGWKVSAQASLQ